MTAKSNALRHGLTATQTILPWEDETAFQAMRATLHGDFDPVGETERHLVDDLVQLMWRKQRVTLAENAILRRGLKSHMIDAHNDPCEAATAHLPYDQRVKRGQTREALNTILDPELIQEQENTIQAAQTALEQAEDYETLLATLDPTDQENWHDWLDEPGSYYKPDLASLQRFVNKEIIDCAREQVNLLHSAQTIRQQLFGECALSLTHQKSLQRYETHIDRKFEKTLAMLLKLQSLRKGPADSDEFAGLLNRLNAATARVDQTG